MAEEVLSVSTFYGGISDDSKIGIGGSFAFGRHLNIFDDSSQLSILPKGLKVSGTTVTALIKWIADGTPHSTSKFFYDEDGNIYEEDGAGTWSVILSLSNSHGQGLEVFDNYLYYTQDTQIGRRGLLSGTPSNQNDWQTGLNDTAASGFAPIKAFGNTLVVGHGNYVGLWDGAVWDPDRLVLPPGTNIRSIEILDEYIVFGTWRGSNITDNNTSTMYFWDGISQNANFFIEMKEGGVNGMTNTKQRLFSVLGCSGGMFMNYRPANLIQRLPKITVRDYVEVLPGAVTNWQNKVFVGAAVNTSSTDFEHGLYCFASKGERYPEVINYAHSISTGNATGTDIKIGGVLGLGNSLYFAWKDDTTYGVDKVSISNDPYASAEWQSLIYDGRAIHVDKKAVAIKATHFPLVSGESIKVGYKINREASFNYSDVNAEVGSTETRLAIPVGDDKWREIQFSIVLATSVSTTPTVTGFAFDYDNLADDQGGF